VWLDVVTSRAAIWAVFQGSYCIASSLGVHVEGGANVSAPGCIRDNMPVPAALQPAARPLAKCPLEGMCIFFVLVVLLVLHGVLVFSQVFSTHIGQQARRLQLALLATVCG
jgi:hypothetical protein